MNATPIYSYHTFLYPFLYQNASSQNFFHLFDNNEKWMLDVKFSEGAEDTELKKRLDYQVFQYFNASTRNTLFGNPTSENPPSRSYCLCFPEGERTYEIQPPSNASTKKIFDPIILHLNAIRIRIFNTGVAILVYETEYRPEPGLTPEQKRNHVKQINEYGRRLYPEYLPSAPFPVRYQSSMLCAEKITIRIPGMEPICDDFRSRAEAHLKRGSEEESYLNNLIFLPDIVGKVLNFGLDSPKIGCRGEKKKAEFTIQPAIDDRMFVCCVLRDHQYVESFLGYPTSENEYEQRQSHTWKFRTDWLTGQELYALTNIDDNVSDQEGSSCQNRVDLDRYFDEQLYLRWIEYGTIHAVTNHSMVCLTSENPVADHIVNSFLTLYVPICILTVAQRASLLAFDHRITDCVSSAQGKKSLDKEHRKKLYDIAEDFSIFQGEILLAEVTPQIQGIELYEKLQTMLFIDHLEENVQNQLNNLFQIARSRQEDDQLMQDRTLTVIGIVLAMLTIPSFFEGFIQSSGILRLAHYLIVGVIVGVTLIAFLKNRKRNKSRKK